MKFFAEIHNKDKLKYEAESLNMIPQLAALDRQLIIK